MSYCNCAWCGRKILKKDAFLSCNGSNDRPVWLCDNCDLMKVIDNTPNVAYYLSNFPYYGKVAIHKGE